MLTAILSILVIACAIALLRVQRNALRASKERLELALLGGQQGTWDWDIEAGTVYRDQHYFDILGYKQGDIAANLGGWERLVHPDDLPRVKKILEEHLEAKSPHFQAEFRLWTKARGWRWILDRGKVVSRDSDGRPLRVVGVSQDITDRKAMERALELEKERLDVTLRSIGDAAISTDSRGRVVLLNRVAEELTGWKESEAKGRPLGDVFQIINERTREKAKCPVRQALEKGTVVGLANHTVLIARDGTERNIADSAAPIHDKEGNILGVILVFRDVTEEKRMAEALRDSQARYRDLYEASPIGLVTCDGAGNILEVNRHMLRLIGSPRKEEILKLNLLRVPEITRSGAHSDLKKALETKEVITRERRMKFRTGVELWLRYRINAIVEENGAIREVTIACEDVTAEKERETKIRYLSFRDKLTGLYNRAYFEEEIDRLDTDRQLPLSIIMGDVNGLKLVNDAFGHHEGDNLLKEIARILEGSCRKEDIITRWGGDEFAILLPRTGASTAEQICQRIKAACAKSSGPLVKPSIALGTATKENPADRFDEVVTKAEDRMYRNKLIESSSTRGSIISSLTSTLREKSFETEEHAERLKALALALGRALGLSGSELDELSLMAALHDIGKIAISDDILTKAGRLTPEEWEAIRKHPEIGYRIAQSTPDLAPIAEAILAHHEQWDGTGYPRGLKGEEIPLVARIISLVDSFDVMTHERPYRQPISEEEALLEIKRCSGTQFDPQLAEVFVRMFDTKGWQQAAAASSTG